MSHRAETGNTMSRTSDVNPSPPFGVCGDCGVLLREIIVDDNRFGARRLVYKCDRCDEVKDGA